MSPQRSAPFGSKPGSRNRCPLPLVICSSLMLAIHLTWPFNVAIWGGVPWQWERSQESSHPDPCQALPWDVPCLGPLPWPVQGPRQPGKEQQPAGRQQESVPGPALERFPAAGAFAAELQAQLRLARQAAGPLHCCHLQQHGTR